MKENYKEENMSKDTKKFYKPGTLAEKGTKISLKTQPYINGVIFDTNDPIASFHYYIIALKAMVEEYEMLRNIPGINESVPSCLDLQNGITGKAKLLLEYLAQSPIEVVLKTQTVDNDLLATLEVANGRTN